MSNTRVIDSLAESSKVSNEFLSYNIKEFHIKEKQINKDITFSSIEADLNYRDSFSKFEGINHFNGIIVNVVLDGGYQLENKQYKFNSTEDSTNIININKEHLKLTFNNNKHFKGFFIMVSRNFLKNNQLEQIYNNKKGNSLLKHTATDAITKISISEILNSPYDGTINNLFFQGRILDILSNEFSHIQQINNKKQNCHNLLLNEQDIKALNKAKDILIQNIYSPPSIKELSRLVALNEFKLKAGFKAIFKTTPYNIVKIHRMEIAKELLKTSEYNIGEVSKLIGIKSQAHFTKTFFKFYKVLPKEVMKTRKYYY